MDEADLRQTWRIFGHVKWFDPGRGFGFIVSDADAPDILIHANVLRNFGQSSVAEGIGIEVRAMMTDRGMQAVEVLDIHPPENPEPTGLDDIDELSPDTVAATPMRPARVKWFDRARGFGFASIFGCERDVFVHIEVVRLSGFCELDPGEAVALRVVEGQRGLMAVRVSPWEMAVGSGMAALV